MFIDYKGLAKTYASIESVNALDKKTCLMERDITSLEDKFSRIEIFMQNQSEMSKAMAMDMTMLKVLIRKDRR
jgi:hypothetical protein